MKISLILGKQQGMSIKPRLLDIKDNLDIDCYDTVPDFIDNALKRNCIYDRILVLSNKLTKKTQKDLYKYWGSTSKETQIVMLGKSGSDNDKATEFLQQFKTPVVATVLVESTTISLIAEAVLRPTAELSSSYGIGNFLEVELDEDVYVEPVKEEPVQQQPSVQNTQQSPQNTQQANQQVAQSQQPVKKGGFFSSLFGGRKKAKKPQQAQKEPPVSLSDVKDELTSDNFDIQDNSFIPEEYYGEPAQNSQPVPTEQQVTYQPTVNDFNANTPQPLEDTDSWNAQNTSNMTENYEANSPTPSPLPQKQNDFNSFSEPVYMEEDKSQDDFNPEYGMIDEDFGSMGFTEEYAQESRSQVSDELTQVDTDFNDENLGDYENQYREATEAPKVVTQTVVKEVIRNINSDDKLNVLHGVYGGRLKKTVVVSGDRGSGVTSTAFNIAQTLAKKVDVLYFDCDIYNHGLLNYIDYDSFKNYENNHMNGIKFCRTSQAFDTCVINWSENLYLLTSDFDCEATPEELQRTAGVVAERAVDFSVVVVDCPVSLLHCVDELILTGQSVTCVEGSKRGFMNMLCMFEASELGMRYKRTFASRDTMLVTKCTKNLDLKKLVSYIKAIYEPNEVDWMINKPVPFNGKLTEALLNTILEG